MRLWSFWKLITRIILLPIWFPIWAILWVFGFRTNSIKDEPGLFELIEEPEPWPLAFGSPLQIKEDKVYYLGQVISLGSEDAVRKSYIDGVPKQLLPRYTKATWNGKPITKLGNQHLSRIAKAARTGFWANGTRAYMPELGLKEALIVEHESRALKNYETSYRL